ncbi:MAG: peptidoglycan-associated lipoprotein Pal [Geobacteraceae bacterium]|nr:peptidoglycan-associated lipoprotein Pal [Geobacteraceae bacterium]
MKREMITLLAAMSMTALVSGGCANKEAVKTEEPAPATIKAEPVKAEPATTEAAKPVQEPSAKIEENKIVPAKTAEPAATPAPESVLETVYFDFDKSDLSQDARNVLSKNAETLLKSMKDAKIKIEGNCDERGSAEYNLALGERRAKSAQQYLLTLGVQPDRLSIISYGKEKPAVDGHDEAAWAKNRRDDFVIVK